MDEELIDFAIGKLIELQIIAHKEDKNRGKVRYVKKVQAYSDLIRLLNKIKKEVI